MVISSPSSFVPIWVFGALAGALVLWMFGKKEDFLYRLLLVLASTGMFTSELFGLGVFNSSCGPAMFAGSEWRWLVSGPTLQPHWLAIGLFGLSWVAVMTAEVRRAWTHRPRVGALVVTALVTFPLVGHTWTWQAWLPTAGPEEPRWRTTCRAGKGTAYEGTIAWVCHDKDGYWVRESGQARRTRVGEATCTFTPESDDPSDASRSARASHP